MKKAFFIFLLVFCFPLSSFGQTATMNDWQPEEKAQIEKDFAAYSKIVEAKDAEGSIAVLPPAFFNYFAKQNDLNAEDFKKHMISVMNTGYSQMEAIRGEFHPNNIRYRQTTKGEKYAIIPYTTHVTLQGNKTIDADSLVMALIIDDKSYFLDIGTPNKINVIKLIFPQLKDIDTSVN